MSLEYIWELESSNCKNNATDNVLLGKEKLQKMVNAFVCYEACCYHWFYFYYILRKLIDYFTLKKVDNNYDVIVNDVNNT